MKQYLSVCWLWLAIAFPSLPLQAAEPVAKIQSMLAKPKVLCGNFEQTKQLAGLKKPLVSTGRFCVVANKGVVWRTLHPFPNTLRLTRDEITHVQGDRVAMRLDAKQEPTVRIINGVLFALLAGDLTQLESLFKVDGSIQNNHWKVALKAREPALAKTIGSIDLEGDAYVKSIVISETSGDRTSIVFSGITNTETVPVTEKSFFE